MARRASMRRSWLAGLMVAGGSTVLAWSPSCEGLLTRFNPCSTVLGFCDANDIDLLFTDIPNYELDPTCTIPYLEGCSAGNIFPNDNRP
ncbi:MAG: hypothetical protein KJ057_03250 [Phycisphaerae bacterium]|nr:MAG: hypothetical protein F9K17_14065 [Phycisphaerae bacterium]MBE7457668.1 hypothetical protein [Planctomycetia bacterium]MCK6463815.1 hypothetical protein [Phycisphaerae bacterium]MCL4717470.1 hypothetical protein [Phycisphaerae bacterium]NUQ07613.1 hypothetical protein [Phycisphaerae bacterium]